MNQSGLFAFGCLYRGTMFNPFKKPIAYFVRHGDTELNDENRYRGWADVPLNANGYRAADELAHFFSYERIGKVTCSDLQRAIQTSEAIMATGVVACQYLDINPNLRPWNIGNFSGRSRTEENTQALKYYVDHPDIEIPDGESLNRFRDRQLSMIDGMSNLYGDEPTIYVCHTSNLTMMRQIIDPAFAESPEDKDIVAPGGIVAIYYNEDGTMEMVPRLGEIIEDNALEDA